MAFCTGCGSTLAEGQAFCGTCGARAEADTGSFPASGETGSQAEPTYRRRRGSAETTSFADILHRLPRFPALWGLLPAAVIYWGYTSRTLLNGMERTYTLSQASALARTQPNGMPHSMASVLGIASLLAFVALALAVLSVVAWRWRPRWFAWAVTAVSVVGLIYANAVLNIARAAAANGSDSGVTVGSAPGWIFAGLIGAVAVAWLSRENELWPF